MEIDLNNRSPFGGRLELRSSRKTVLASRVLAIARPAQDATFRRRSLREAESMGILIARAEARKETSRRLVWLLKCSQKERDTQSSQRQKERERYI